MSEVIKKALTDKASRNADALRVEATKRAYEAPWGSVANPGDL